MNNTVVLAFSGGLDTSFCVPYLIENGYQVHTLFVDSGGVSEVEKKRIERRALELGATQHHQVAIAQSLWTQLVIPAIQAGYWYQHQYPLLCSDRYLIVAKCLALCDQLNTQNFAHGCTGMGNDQVRFDLTVKSLGNYRIITPIREIQQRTTQLRDYEENYLNERGFSLEKKYKSYSINENILGITLSGSEVDEFDIPNDSSWQLSKHPRLWPNKPLTTHIEFLQGVAISIDGTPLQGPDILQNLNQSMGAYGVGRGIYTGDTTIGLKGRIVFEAPALTALQTAHRALEEAVCTQSQNQFKPNVAKQWSELVYKGLYHDPLKKDLEAYLKSSQSCVNGRVSLQTMGGIVHAVAIDSPHILLNENASYAQSANWGAQEASGFIQLFGQSTELWNKVNSPS